MPDEGLCLRVGEKRRVKQTVYHDAAVAITAVTATVLDAGGETLELSTAGSASPAAPETATEHVVSYVLDTTGLPPGDTTVTISYECDGETVALPVAVSLFPSKSVFDRWAQRMSSWLLESGFQGARALSLREYRDAALAAVAEYSRGNPRRLVAEVALADGVREYPLPADWAAGFSRVESVEYPFHVLDLAVDEARGVWRLTGMAPVSGMTLRLRYTGPHVVRDAAGGAPAVDSIPAGDFHAVAQYAAGLALLAQASAAARTNQPAIGADLVNTRTKEQEFGARARAMMEEARDAWPHTRSLSVGGSAF